MSDLLVVAIITVGALVGAFGLIGVFVFIWRLTASWCRRRYAGALSIAVMFVVALAWSLGKPLLLLFRTALR